MKANIISEHQANDEQENVATWVGLLEWVNTTCVSFTRLYPQSTFTVSLILMGQTRQKEGTRNKCTHVLFSG